MKPLLTCLFNLLIFSQQEASNWYFGQNAGLKFHENGIVTPLINGQLNTAEGCATISDSQGNLLFYTDGRSVWDRNHVIMPNANYFSGTGLLGDPSSTHSAIIVPNPGNSNQYYIFTLDEPHHINAQHYPNQSPSIPNQEHHIPNDDDGFNNGLNYSIVDLSVTGSNGSIGDVIASNVHLVTYNTNPNLDFIKYKCSEKITAVRNFFDQSYWVIVHFYDSFYAFKVTGTGVVANPVISTTGTIIPISGYRRNAIGQIKSSPDGTRIALSHNQISNVTGSEDDNSGVLEVFNFNVSTGIVSSPITIETNRQFYGVEFSPNSKLLYATYRINHIAQYNLEANNILASGLSRHQNFCGEFV